MEAFHILEVRKYPAIVPRRFPSQHARPFRDCRKLLLRNSDNVFGEPATALPDKRTMLPKDSVAESTTFGDRNPFPASRPSDARPAIDDAR